MPLIPATGFAGPPTLDGPTPGRTKLVPLIVPRLSAEGLTFGFAFDGGRANAPPVLARPPLVFAPKPVGAAAGSLTNAGRSCCWPRPCSMSWRATGKPIASRVTPPGLSWADRRGRKIGRANGQCFVSAFFAASRLPGARGCTVMRVSIVSESLPAEGAGLTSPPAAFPFCPPSPATGLLSPLPFGAC